MELVLAAIAISSVVGTAVGWFGHGKLSKTEYTGHEAPTPPLRWGDRSEHEHTYDRMLPDGKGWRCGICGKPRSYSKK